VQPRIDGAVSRLQLKLTTLPTVRVINVATSGSGVVPSRPHLSLPAPDRWLGRRCSGTVVDRVIADPSPDQDRLAVASLVEVKGGAAIGSRKVPRE